MAYDDEYTVSLLHFNGANNSTTFTDESGKTWTPSGGAKITTTQSVFGGASGYMVANGYITTPSVSDFAFGTGDFTVDFRIRLTGLNYPRTYIEFNNGAHNNNITNNDASGNIRVHLGASNTSYDFATGLSANTWYHIALVRSGTDLMLFKDGTKVGSNQTDSTNITSNAYSLQVGGPSVDSYIDELRIGKGVARWTSNFTPPSDEYYYNVYQEECDDALSAVDSTSNDVALGGASNDSVVASDSTSVQGVYNVIADDSLSLGDSPSYGSYDIEVDDVLSAVDYTVNTLLHTATESIYDSVAIVDLPMIGFIVNVLESLVLNDAALKILGVTITDYVTFIESLIPTGTRSIGVQDQLYFYEALSLIGQIALSIADAIATADSSDVSWEVALLEYLYISELFNISNAMSALSADVQSLSDTTSYSWDITALDALIAICTTLNNWTSNALADDSATAVDATSCYLIINVVGSDKVSAVDAITFSQILQGLISESLFLNVSLYEAGDLWQCWVLNSSKLNASVFSNFGFNSFCQFNNKSYGMKEDGIYLLEGSTDSGTVIHPGILLSSSNFGSENAKYFRSGFLGMVAGNVPAIKITNEDNESKIYEIAPTGTSKLSRDIRGKYLTIAISNFTTLDFVELIPIVLTRQN